MFSNLQKCQTNARIRLSHQDLTRYKPQGKKIKHNGLTSLIKIWEWFLYISSILKKRDTRSGAAELETVPQEVI